jgi:hypothetical protein
MLWIGAFVILSAIGNRLSSREFLQDTQDQIGVLDCHYRSRSYQGGK